ncbi:MAG: potassium/proton antiporter, partial [Vulcanococcus sp.]
MASLMWINLAMLLAGVLLLLGIASSKFSARVGVPVLVLFLSVGMLAGSEGFGRIPFENYDLASSIGSVALALIL